MSKKLIAILGVVLIAGSFGYLLWEQIRDRQLALKLDSTGIKAPATVMTLWSSQTGFSRHYWVDYDYPDASLNGQPVVQHRSQQIDEAYYSSLKVGQQIDIRYLKNDPTQALIVGHEQEPLLDFSDYLFIAGIGLVFVLPTLRQTLKGLMEWVKAGDK